MIRGLSLQLVLDGHIFNLTGPGSRYAILPCGGGSDDCVPTTVESELAPTLLRALIVAQKVEGDALGFPIQLAPSDQRALAEFAARAGAARQRGRMAPTSDSVLHR